MIDKIKKIIKKLPKKPGVYEYYDKNGHIIYIGKASILKHRISSYFTKANDLKTERLVSEICNIKIKETKTVIEALILESNLIKKYKPKYNIREKDDKSFIQIVLTDEKFPSFLVVRPTQKEKLKNIKIKKYFGPYTDALSAKEILKILRKIFGFRDCSNYKFNQYKKRKNACLYYSINLCPAPCINKISKLDYKQTVKNISDILDGKQKKVIRILKKQMKEFSNKKKFEEAAQIRDRIFAFEHINDVALIKKERSLEQNKNIPNRIEAYDISNIGKDFAVGSMVVFTSGEIDTDQYRKFRIKTIFKQNDPAMMAEIIKRRFKYQEWEKPDLIILDGGKGQLSFVLNALRTLKLKIPIIALAKGPSRKGFALFKNKLAKNIYLEKKFIESIRDEAHRFAIKYHRELKIKSIR